MVCNVLNFLLIEDERQIQMFNEFSRILDLLTVSSGISFGGAVCCGGVCNGQDDYFDGSDVISTILCVMIDHQNLNM